MLFIGGKCTNVQIYFYSDLEFFLTVKENGIEFRKKMSDIVIRYILNMMRLLKFLQISGTSS